MEDGGRVRGTQEKQLDPCFIESAGWICEYVYRCANYPNATKGTCAVGEYANQGCVPKIRAHNSEDIPCSSLMVIGESVSSDCCLKDPSVLSSEFLQCLSVHLTVRKYISLFFFWYRSLIVNWHLYMTCHIKAFKAQRGAVTPGKKSWTPVLWFYQGDIAWRKKK